MSLDWYDPQHPCFDATDLKEPRTRRHTPEPWKKAKEPGSDPTAFMIVSGELTPELPQSIAHWMREANADRIVAAVNAVAGIPTEELTRLGLGGLAKIYADKNQSNA